MSKLTTKEKLELWNYVWADLPEVDYDVFDDEELEKRVNDWVEKKKKEWQEEAYEKTKTKFFCAIGFLDDKDYQTVYKIIESMGG